MKRLKYYCSNFVAWNFYELTGLEVYSYLICMETRVMFRISHLAVSFWITHYLDTDRYYPLEILTRAQYHIYTVRNKNIQVWSMLKDIKNLFLMWMLCFWNSMNIEKKIKLKWNTNFTSCTQICKVSLRDRPTSEQQKWFICLYSK